MSKKNEIMVAPAKDSAGASLIPWVKGETFEMLSGLATKFSQSQLVPDMFKGKPHDCFIALQMALRMNEDPMWVLQNLTLPKGKPSLGAPAAIERANRLGPFSEDIDFEISGEGDDLSVTAFAPLRKNGEVRKATVTMKMAKLEGWTKNPKYQTMPEQMLCYRAATFLIRRHCPAILMGMPTLDEVEDIYASGRGARWEAPERAPSGAEKVADLNSQIEQEI